MTAPQRIEPHDLPGLYLQEIDQSGVLPKGVTAEDAAAAVLCTLVQDISRDSMSQVIDSAPAGLLPFFKSCPLHRQHDEDRFDETEFVDRVSAHLPGGVAEIDEMIRTVLKITHRWLQSREAAIIGQELPPDLQKIWNEV